MESLDLEAPRQARKGRFSQLVHFLRRGAHSEAQPFERLGQEDVSEHEENIREGKMMSRSFHAPRLLQNPPCGPRAITCYIKQAWAVVIAMYPYTQPKQYWITCAHVAKYVSHFDSICC